MLIFMFNGCGPPGANPACELGEERGAEMENGDAGVVAMGGRGVGKEVVSNDEA